MRLILEENGETRRFKLNQGTLTVGSGENCTLKVKSADVADVHLEIRVEGEDVVIVPRKGVGTVKVGGIALKSERKIVPGQKVAFGSAVLRTEDEKAAAAKGVKAKARATKGAAEGSNVQRRSRRTEDKSLPTWAILLLAIPLIFLAYKTFATLGEGDTVRPFNELSSQERLKTALAEGDFKTAEAEFVKIDQQELTAEWSGVFGELRKKLVTATSKGDNAERNRIGTRFLDKQIKNYKTKYLSKNERPQARVFVRRAEWFLMTWPDHPEAAYVRRLKTQFATVGRMSEASSLADVTWEAKTLTWAFPANYKKAFKVLNEFLDRAEAGDATVVRGLIATHELEEKAYFDERLDLAAGLYEDNNKSKALGYCIQLVIGINNQSMEDNAASRITKMAGVAGTLEAIKRDAPEDFNALAKNATMATFFRKLKLL